MSGQPFLAVTAPGELRLEVPSQRRVCSLALCGVVRTSLTAAAQHQDVEFAGCYSLSGGACINMIGGKLHTERVAFAASLAAVRRIPASDRPAPANLFAQS